MKTSHLYIFITSVILVIAMTSCPMDINYGLCIKNNSKDTLYTLCRWDDYYLSNDTLYYDSTRYVREKVFPYCHTVFIGYTGEDPEEFLKTTDTITVFILDRDEFENKTWNQLVGSAHFRQIYHLSGDDIRLLKSEIPYPPSDAMRHMVMDPPYEEAVRN